MKTIVIVAAAIAAGSSAAFAQNPPQTAAPVQTTQATVPAPAPEAVARPAPPSEQRLREVKFMEEVLASAVKAGATDLATRIRQVDPNSLLAVSPPHARGIALDGYGVVFDVDVPLANVAIVTTLRENVVNDLRDQIRDIDQYLARATNPDDQQRLTLQRRLLMSSLQMMAPTPTVDPRVLTNTVLDPRGPTGLAPIANQQPPGSVSAATTDAIAPVPRIEAKDTNKIYSDAVKNALIDAMLDHSAALHLADEEWLVVAARDNSGPSMDGALDPKSGILLRVKGSDLTAFQRNQLSRDEVLKRLEIREWR